MPRAAIRTLFMFLCPGGLLFLVGLGFLRPHGLPVWCQGPVSALPYVALTFGLLFGWYFASTRMVLSLVSLTFASQALATWPVEQDPASVSRVIFAASTFLLPLNFLAFSLIKEDGVGTFRGLGRVLLFLLQPFAVLWLSDPAQRDLATAFQMTYLPGWSTHWTAIPQAALLVFLISGLLHVIRFLSRRDPMDAGAAWALGAVFLAYHGSQLGWQATNFFSTAGLILFLSLVQASYQRTYRDELTGIPGRVAYEEASAQLGKHFTIAVLAVDQLKSYAGTHGKSVVEQILKLVAPHVQAACQTGQVFRVSGEELTLLFRQQSAVQALVELEQIRKRIEATAFFLRGTQRVWENTRGVTPDRKDQSLPITVSIGVADASAEAITQSVVIKAAYRALYDAKAGGGNTVKRTAATNDLHRRSYTHSAPLMSGSRY